MTAPRDTGSSRNKAAAGARKPRSAASQRGGFGMGIVVGLLIGLALALGVALYIAKVPVPFVDKVPHRSAEQDAAETERLKSWDPNAPLAGKQAPRPAMRPSGADSTASDSAEGTHTMPVAPGVVASAPARAASRPASAPAVADAAPRSTRDPAAILAGQASGARGGDPFLYFVQVGAYSNADDAEAQRAKLAMQGLGAKLTEREQSGRVVHRVRLGPFDSRDEAENQQERVRALGSEASLVRVDRSAPR